MLSDLQSEQGTAPVEGETPEPEDTTEDTTSTELTLAQAVENIEDASRMVAGAAVEDAVQVIREVAAIAVSAAKTATETYRKAAAAIARHARRNVLLPSGIPDWAGDSTMAQTILSYSLDRVLLEGFETPGDRRKVRNSIMAHLDRTFLELEIRDWVWRTTETLTGGELKYWSGEDDEQPDDTNTSFLADVRKAYKSAGKKIPPKYQSPEDKAAGRGDSPTAGPANPTSVTRKGIEASAHLTAERRALAALDMVSRLVHDIEEKQVRFASQDERNRVSEIVARISVVSMFGAKVLDGAANEKDTEQVSASYFNEDEDTPKDDENDGS